MSKLIVGSAVAALALGLMASPSFAGEVISQKLEQGSSNGVSYSYLTTNSSDSGSTSDALWKIQGNVSFDWDGTDGSGGSGTISVWNAAGTTQVGSLSIVSIDLTGGTTAGATRPTSPEFASITFNLTGNGNSTAFDNLVDDDDGDGDGTSDNITVGFLNWTYKGAFNSFGPTASGPAQNSFEMALWGNENQHNSGSSATGNNWGLDWKSSPVPLPAPFLLGLAGLGMVGWMRKRRMAG